MDSQHMVAQPGDSTRFPQPGNSESSLPLSVSHDLLAQGIEQATLALIANLFPLPTLGQLFVTRFLERAAAERSSMPDLKVGDFLICTTGLASLSRELHLAYDTVQKYVALYQALGLLQRRAFMDKKRAYILSLGIYLPPRDLEARLDLLLQRSKTKKSRTKYHELVRNVKERCLVYGVIDQEFTTALQQLSTLLKPPAKGQSRRTLEQRFVQAQHLVSRLMAYSLTDRHTSANLPGTPTHADSSRWEKGPPPAEVRRHTHEGRAPNLSSSLPRDEAKPQQQTWESIQQTGSDRFTQESTAPNLSRQHIQEDSQRPSSRGESPQQPAFGRFATTRVATNLSKPAKQVDSQEQAHGKETAQTGEAGRFGVDAEPSNLSSSAEQVDSDNLANVNVGSFITSNINVNVEAVAVLMCHVFGEAKSKRGIYSKLFRGGCNRAEAVHAAALFALVHFHRDHTIENPAAVFIARCRAYHQTGIPEEAAQLVQAYGHLTYQQLLDQVQQQQRSHALLPSTRPQAMVALNGTSPNLPPIPKPTDLVSRIPLKSGGGMPRESALRLRSHIAHDRRFGLCRTGVVALADGSFAVLLDNTVIPTKVRQVALYTLEEWQTGNQEVCTRLFASAARSALARYRSCTRVPETNGEGRKRS